MENTNNNYLRKTWLQIKAYCCRDSHLVKNDPVMIFELIDIFMHIVFLMVTTHVTMSTREISMFHYEKAVEKHFIERSVYNEYGYEMTFKDLVTVADWWSYIETTFVENVSEFGSQDEGEINAAENNILLESPRLRQIRVKNETCSIHNAFKKQFRTCYGGYSKNNEDVNGFFNKTYFTKTYPIWGKIATYHGPGYVETLSLNPDENENILSYLKSFSWIDRGTRIIILEFVSFNANVNLLCCVKMLTEIVPSGGILTSSSIQPLRTSILCEGYFEYFCVLIFYVLIFFNTFEMVLKVLAIGFTKILYSFWNILDTIVVLLGYLSLIYITWHTIYLNHVLDGTFNESDIISNVDIVCYWNLFFNTGMGICVFIVWIKILKYIQMSKTMLRFSTTIKKCMEDIFGFAIMFAIVFVAYAALAVLLFGTVHADFRDFPTAMLTMMRMVLGDLYYSEMEEGNPILGPLFFLSYILFVFFILLNMFLAIINDTYSGITAEITSGKNKGFVELRKHLLKKLKEIPFVSKQESSLQNELTTRHSNKQHNLNEKNQKDFLDSLFKPLPKPKTAAELNTLNQRLFILEKTVDNLCKCLDEVFKK